MSTAHTPTDSDPDENVALRPALDRGRRVVFGIDPGAEPGAVAVIAFRDRSGRLFVQCRSAEIVHYQAQEYVHPEDGDVL